MRNILKEIRQSRAEYKKLEKKARALRSRIEAMEQGVVQTGDAGSRQKAPEPVSPILGRRPSEEEIEKVVHLLQPWEWIADPVFWGTNRIPDKGPVLFVGNHTIMGILDVPVMWYELYRQKKIFLRSLGDRIHFKIPVWRDQMAKFGAVEGTRANCATLMEAGEYIVVFPGGAREVFKHKGEKYQLIWKERIGFARMAIQFGCPIVPFAAVGAEECFDIVVDGNEIMRSPLGKILRRLNVREDAVLPIVKGIGPLPIPRPQRFYFYFGKPVDTSAYKGDFENTDFCLRLKETVKASVEEGIEFLLEYREKDDKRKIGPWLLHKLEKGRHLADPDSDR